MIKKIHSLSNSYLGTQREIVSFHYGTPDTGEKIYIQASLHADELPGMMVAHQLRQMLAKLEDQQQLRGEVVVVPVANPIGLAQTLLRNQLGRFDVATGENFNRHYPALFSAIKDQLGSRLTSSEAENTKIIRAAMRAHLSATTPASELASMRHVLMSLACDADVVLDLHCDFDAVLHLYTGTPLWPQCEPLARALGAYATLLATESGDNPFDEACSQTWWQLAAAFPSAPIAMACLAVTVELRGQMDVGHDQAAKDAQAIIDFLVHRGVVAVAPNAMPSLPALLFPATPLAGSEAIESDVSGVVAFIRKPGDVVKAGDLIAEVVDPLSGAVKQVYCKNSGVLYARENRYFATVGMRLAKVASAEAFRTGNLLSA
jgi:uncharacterized protein